MTNPFVSVIVPCYNEEKTIGLLLAALRTQSWPSADMEVIIADGLSSDATRAKIAEFCDQHPEMKVVVVTNERRNIPAALNTALDHAHGEFIVRLDAHSIPSIDYIERSLADLRSGQADMVGGIWQIRPGGPGWVARSIASAAAHPLGVGDALYRYATRAALVDTVPFGAYRRDLLDRVGRYDETLLTNEDYELNTRIRLNGGRIWLNPAIRSVYFARSTFGALAKQYARYGYWKVQMLRRFPRSLRWRQALPPLFVLSLLVLAPTAFFWPVARVLLAVEIAIYCLVLLFAASKTARRQNDAGLLLGIPLGIAVMHISWGAGFWLSMVKSVFKISQNGRGRPTHENPPKST